MIAVEFFAEFVGHIFLIEFETRRFEAGSAFIAVNTKGASIFCGKLNSFMSSMCMQQVLADISLLKKTPFVATRKRLLIKLKRFVLP